MASNKKNTLWLATQFSTTLLLSLVNLKLNIMTFGNDIFALWLIISSLWTFGGALDLGFGISTVRFVSQNKYNANKIIKILGTSFLLYIFLGILIFTFISMVGYYFYLSNETLIIPSNYSNASKIFIILGISFYFLYLNNFFKAVFEGHSQFIAVTIINLISSISMFLLVLLIYLFHLTIVHLALVNLFIAFTTLSMSIFFFHRKFPALHFRNLQFDFAIFKEIFKFSLSVQITYLIGALIDPVAKFILGLHSDKSFVTIYEIAKRFSLAVSSLFGFSFKYSITNASALKSQNDYHMYIYTTCTKISKFGQFFSVSVFGVLSPFFLLLFTNFYGYSECFAIFLIFALAESVNNIGYILYAFIVGVGGVKYLAILQFTNLTLNSLFLFLGIRYFNSMYGFIGFFFAVIIANIAMMVYIKKIASIQILDFYKSISMHKSILYFFIIIINISLFHFYHNNFLVFQFCFSFVYIILYKKEFNYYIKNTLEFLVRKRIMLNGKQ